MTYQQKTSRRFDPALRDIYVTHSAVLLEPTLTPPQSDSRSPDIS